MIFMALLIVITFKTFYTQLGYIKSYPNSYYVRISSIILLYAGVLSLNTFYIQAIGSGIGIYSGLFHVTQVSQMIEVIIYITGFFILSAWPIIKNNIIKNNSYPTDYSILVLFSTLGSCLLLSTSDLISMYLSIELQSFSLYILSTLYRDSESSTSAGLKYFLLGGLSSCIILLGSGIIYAYTGITNFESLYSLVSITNYNYIIQGLSLGIILIFVGLLFKISSSPFHQWAPDVYDDTPTIVTIWLTIIPKISILILLLELYTQLGIIGSPSSILINTNGYVEYLYSDTTNIISESLNNLIDLQSSTMNVTNKLLLISSILSLIIGTVVGLAQTKIKRLLAYSTISHIGFILLSLAINSVQSIDSLLFYIIQYTITNLNIFLIIIAISYCFIKTNINNDNTHKDIKYISELKGLFFLNPLLSLSLAICLFSMAGIPPLIGFFSKQFVLYSAVQEGYNFISIVAILASVVSASYYLKIIKVLYTSIENEDTISLESENNLNSKDTVPLLVSREIQRVSSEANKVSSLSSDYFVEKQSGTIELTNFHSYLISLLTLSILFFILKPNLILNSTQLLSLSIFNF
jgi:NADH-ubiquinone oxidoreductase chain 2|uniref:NADH-ubiquinone oxidoreductase chain 2 n=1 Tax=Amanita brunnescens TaxID=87326 RepID=A0A5Q0N227_AMABU|nr:NADH dehydrogenase subunit 2 [Amanita brunnescens]QFZ98574.1 NADH dehydrogenase subunit 2 [Amanita brunnescens]